VSVIGCNPAHGHVGHIEEGHFALVDLELLLLEEVEVEKFAVLLLVVVLHVQALLLLFELHLALLVYRMLQDSTRGSADISEVVDRERVISSDDRVVDVLDACLLLQRFDVVAKLVEFVIELPDSLNLLQVLELSQFADFALDGHVPEEGAVLVLLVAVVHVEVLGYLMEVVLSLLRKLEIGILMGALRSTIDDLLVG
jgi:hypothetical protein